MNIALFDFDGTITSKDSFAPFIRFAVTPTRAVFGALLLAPIIIGYKLRLIPASFTRACLARFGFRGRRLNEIREIGSRFASEILPNTIRQKAMERIDWHRAEGDIVDVVSAALDVYLSSWCQQNGLELVCTELESKNGVLTGRYLNGDCTGIEKLKRIMEKYSLETFGEIYAYGDTREDEVLLSVATKKYFRWREITDISEIEHTSVRVDEEPNR